MESSCKYKTWKAEHNTTQFCVMFCCRPTWYPKHTNFCKYLVRYKKPRLRRDPLLQKHGLGVEANNVSCPAVIRHVPGSCWVGVRLCPNVYSLHCNNRTHHYMTTHIYIYIYIYIYIQETKQCFVSVERCRDKNIGCSVLLPLYKVNKRSQSACVWWCASGCGGKGRDL